MFKRKESDILHQRNMEIVKVFKNLLHIIIANTMFIKKLCLIILTKSDRHPHFP